MKTHHLRLAAMLASFSSALLITACQPAQDKNDALKSAKVEAEPSEAADTNAHDGHDMSSAMTSTGEVMADMNNDYMASMTKMHEEMSAATSYNDPDMAFAQGMLGHHLGAVDMAKIELKYGADAEMRQLAQDIIAAQEAEMATLKSWLATHTDAKLPTEDTEDFQKDYASGMDEMHDDMMKGIADPNPDMAFARGMLPHHVGAVDMAKVQLKYGKDEQLRQLAQNIIDAQELEIEQLKRWIDKSGA